jgi:hypothetical protein
MMTGTREGSVMGHAAAAEDTPIYHEVLRDLGLHDFLLEEQPADIVRVPEPEQAVTGYRVERTSDR